MFRLRSLVCVALLLFGSLSHADQIRIRRRVAPDTPPTATPTFLPTGNGALSTWTPNGAATAWDAVNDPVGSPDDDTTYASRTTNDGDQLFTFDTPTASGTINSVSVTTRWRAGPSTFGAVRRILRVGGVNYSGSDIVVSSQTYANGTNTWVTNPRTGVAWTVDDVNGIGGNALQQFGVGVHTLGGVESIWLTATHLTIDYTAAGGGGQPPGVPSGFSPDDDAIDRPVDVTLSCAQQADATSYRIFFGTVSGSLSELTLPDPSICNVPVTGLANSDEVFWTVWPVNGFGQNETAPELSFTVTAAGGGEMDLVAAKADCPDPDDDSPTGRNPNLLWTCERQAVWHQIVDDFETSGCSALASAGACGATPATRAGRWFKTERALAMTAWAPGSTNYGQWNALMYQMTGDPVYITHATWGMYKKLDDWFINGLPATNHDTPRITQGMVVLILEWAWPALTADQRLAIVDEFDIQQDDTFWVYGSGTGRWSDPDQTIGDWYFPPAMMKIILPNNVSNNAIWDDPQMGGFDSEACTAEAAAANLRDGLCFMLQEVSAGGEYLEGPMYAKETAPYLVAMAQAVSDARGVDTYPDVTAFLESYAEQQLHTYTPDLAKQVQYADEQDPNSIASYRIGDTLAVVSGLLQGTAAGHKAHQLLADFIAERGEAAIGPSIRWWGFFVYNPYADVADWKTNKFYYAPGSGSQYLRSGFADSDSLVFNFCLPYHFLSGSYATTSYDHRIWHGCVPRLYKNGEWIIDFIGSYAGASNMAEGNNAMRFNGFGEVREYGQVRQQSLADTHAFMANTMGGGKVYSTWTGLGKPPVMLNEGSRATLGVPGPVFTMVIHDRASVDDIAAGAGDFDRYLGGASSCGEFGQAHITQQHAKQEWLWHIPVDPTVTDNVFTWAMPVTGQSVKLTSLLPEAATRTVYDLATTFAQNLGSGHRCGWHNTQILVGAPHYYTADGGGYDRKLLKIWPSTMGQFHTYLHVLQVGASTPITPTKITNNGAECAHVVTTGQNDLLACFNGATSTVLSNTNYDPAHEAILDSARLRVSGSFTIPVTTVDGTLEVHLADLPPSLTCTYDMDSAGPVAIPSGGAGGLTETGGYARIPLTLAPGAHSLVVSCS